MKRLGHEVSDRFIAIPIAFQLVAIRVVTATAIAVSEFVRVVILECFQLLVSVFIE